MLTKRYIVVYVNWIASDIFLAMLLWLRKKEIMMKKENAVDQRLSQHVRCQRTRKKNVHKISCCWHDSNIYCVLFIQFCYSTICIIFIFFLFRYNSSIFFLVLN